MSLKDIALELFCHFDEENKGYITQDQLLNGSIKEGPFSEFSEGEILSIFTLLDKENKGVITLNDFTDAFVSDSSLTTDTPYSEDRDDEQMNSGDEVYFINNNRQHSFPRMSSWEGNEDIYMSTQSPQVFEYGSTESLPQITTDELYRPDSDGALYRLDGSENDDRNYWCNRVKHVDREYFKRRESLPSVIDPLLIQKARMKLLGAKKWHSVDQGIDKFVIEANGLSLQFELDNNLKNQSMNLASKDEVTKSTNNLIVSLKHSSSELLHQNKPQRRHRRKKRNERNKDILFGSTDSLISSLRCSSCASLRSEKYSSNEDVRLHPLPKKFLSHNNLNVILKHRKRLPRYVTRSSLDLGSEDGSYSDYENYNNKKSSFLSNDNLSFANRNGFMISCENVSTPVGVSAENWESFLKKISGVSMFAGNPKLRYLWKQIGSFQHDLMLPLEDFLKGVVEEHKSVLTKCQEVESMLNSKVEQHEKEMNSIYEEFEKTMHKELKDQEKQFTEKEDSLRMELKKTIDFRDAVCNETVQQASELSIKLQQCRDELLVCQEMRAKSEKRYQQVLEEQYKTALQLESLTQENENLKQQLSTSFEQNKELQDYISQVTNTVDEEKDKYHNFIRKYEDLLEEKEFLEANISNLSSENVELRNLNKSLAHKPDESNLDLSINGNVSSHIIDDVKPITSSPCKESVTRVLSLQDEMNAESAVQEFLNEEEDVYNNDSNNELMNSENKTIKEELEELGNDEDTVTEDVPNESFTSEISIPEMNSAVRFASTVQSEFKVILCGDANSGKTSVIHRICYDTFRAIRKQTFQKDCYKKQVPHGESNINLALWDTVGQEKYNSVPRSYYRKTDVVILLYDITNQQSLTNCKQWLQTIKKCTDENILLLLVGNKLDMESQRTVSEVYGETLAKENDAVFLEVSAKSGENIHSLIHILSSTLVNQTEYVMIQNFFDISTVQKNKLRKHPCCQ